MIYQRLTQGVLAASLVLSSSSALAQKTEWLSKQPVSIAHWTVSGTDTPVYFVPRHDVPMVDVALIFQAGSARDGKQWGLANLTGSLLGTGTHRFEEQFLLERFSSVGATFDTDVSRDAMVVHYRTMTSHRYYSKAIDYLENVVTRARCDGAVTERMKKQIQMSLKAQKDQPSRVAAKMLFKTLYGDHPYAHPVAGTVDTVGALTALDAQAFYKKHLVQKQASVVIVGDLSVSAAHRLAKRLIKGLPVGEPLSPLPLRLAPVPAKQLYVPMKKSQDAILIAQLGFLPYDSHYYARLVGNEVFGGAPLTSMLFKQVRNKRGLAYSAGSQLSALQAGGPFLMGAQSRLSVAKSASRVMRHTFAGFSEKGLTKQKVKSTVSSLESKFPLMYASNADIMSRLETMVIHHYPMTFFSDYPKKIQQVTTDSVKQAFAPLQSQQWVEVVAGGRNIFIREKKR